MSRTTRTLPSVIKLIDCQKSKCAFYVSGYTTEKASIQCCAFEFIALKNAEGLYRV